MRRLISFLVLCTALGALAAPAVTQTPINPLSSTPLFERLSNDAESARWLWGSVRVNPSIGLSDVQFVDNVFVDSGVQQQEPVSDVSASVFAGLNFYQLLGDSSALATFVRPTYTWWQDLSERNRLNLDVGAAAAIEVSRLFLNAEVRSRERLGIATEEAEQEINFKSDTLDIEMGVQIYRSLALFAGFDRIESEHLLEQMPSSLVPNFSRLDRTDETTTAGLRIEPGRDATLAIGFVEKTGQSPITRRDYDGDGVSLSFSLARPNLAIVAAIENVDLQPVAGSTFQPFDQTTGRIQLRLGTDTGRSLAFQARRGLTASVRTAFSDFESTRYQVTGATPLGQRFLLTVGAEEGDRDFRSSVRQDDTRRAFATLRFELVSTAAMTARYERSEIESSEAQFSRDINRFTVDFSIGLSGLAWP